MADDTVDQVDQQDKRLARQEKEIEAAFLAFVAALLAPKASTSIATLLASPSGFNDAMAIVDTYVGKLGDVIPKVAATVGREVMADLEKDIPGKPTPPAPFVSGSPFVPPEPVAEHPGAVSFNPVQIDTAAVVRAHRDQFVKQFADEQHKTTSQAVSRAIREKTSIEDAFRQSVGLNPTQESYVNNYRKKLEGLKRGALDNRLRDPRTDAKVIQAIAQQKPLTPKQIDVMVDRYRRNMIAMRAKTIARTQGIRVAAEATIQAAQQLAKQAGIAMSRLDFVWNPTADERTRAWHASMKGQVRDKSGYFTDGLGNRLRYPGDTDAPIETVASCRCVLTVTIQPANDNIPVRAVA